MDTTKGINTTEQGSSETLVSVQAVGSTAGPPGPSSSDCQETNFTNQTRRDSIGYNWENVKNPFERRSSIKKTPPSSGKLSLNEEPDEVFSTRRVESASNTEDMDQDEFLSTPLSNLYVRLNNDGSAESQKVESPHRKKRKRGSKEDGSPKNISSEMDAVLTVLNSLTKKTDELRQQVKESTKTKIEIKAITRQLVDIVRTLNRKMDILKVSHTHDREKMLEQESTLKEARNDTETTTTSQSIGTQVNDEDIINDFRRVDEETFNKVENTIDMKTGWPGLSTIIDLNWPKKCFKRTEIIEMETLRDLNGNTAFIMDPGTPINKNIVSDLQNFPEVAALNREELEEGCVEYIQTSVVKKREKKASSRITYVLPYHMGAQGINDISKLYDIIKELEKEILTHGITLIKVVTLGKLDIEYLKKCLECIFRNTDVNIQVIIPKSSKKERRMTERNRSSGYTEKVIVRSAGKEYADVLRNIKTNVNIDEIGVKIKTIKKTMKGDVLLEIQGGRKEAEILRQEIVNKNENTQVNIKSNDTIVHITDINGDLDREQIEGCIKKSVGDAKGNTVRVLSCRPNQRGNQTATVAVGKQTANELIKRGSIRIGWTPCRVRMRVNVIRCYKCLEFGHPTKDCKGADKSNICLKCGKENHKAKECENASYCITCKQEGHRADQTKCPYYRKLIREASDVRKNTANAH